MLALSLSTTKPRKLWLQLASGPNAEALPSQFKRIKSRNRDLFDGMTADQRVHVEQLLAKRLSRVPLQHLLGTAAFSALGLLLGGTLRAEGTLAVANGLYLLMLVAGVTGPLLDTLFLRTALERRKIIATKAA